MTWTMTVRSRCSSVGDVAVIEGNAIRPKMLLQEKGGHFTNRMFRADSSTAMTAG
jgi:hypothetical protein